MSPVSVVSERRETDKGKEYCLLGNKWKRGSMELSTPSPHSGALFSSPFYLSILSLQPDHKVFKEGECRLFFSLLSTFCP